MEIKRYDKDMPEGCTLYLYGSEMPQRVLPFSKKEQSYINERREAGNSALMAFDRLPLRLYVQLFNPEQRDEELWEELRKKASEFQLIASKEHIATVVIAGIGALTEEVVAFLEGLYLSNYRFSKYKSKKDFQIETVYVDGSLIDQATLDENINLWKSICWCRDLVNEIPTVLHSESMAELIESRAAEVGVKCTVYGQRQIESMKMGGLLAVNRGSSHEARFLTLDYNPANAINQKPIALVGKGITYDTGGLNIKPDDHMCEMKSDMAGAATMAAVTMAAAENHLPVHIMTFLPLTDNQPSPKAYAADDVLTMYDGTTVEVINTDAEGRLILADAIAFSNQYNPELIIDAATLTGAAVRAIGTLGLAAMHKEAQPYMSMLKIMGDKVYERVAELPFWKEYEELLKSEIADIKNCGPSVAGAITAGKFNAHFAKAPYIHLDIAGVAYHDKRESFYGVGGSGFGVRLLYAFLQTYDMINKVEK